MKKIVFYVFLSAMLYGNIDGGQIYNITGGGKYFFSYPMQKNWYQAMRFCGFHDMQLLSIDSREENDFINNIIRTTPEYFSDSSNFWTSGNDLGENRQFAWATHGNTMAFTDWAPTQPNHAGLEDCVELRGATAFKWNDANCQHYKYFICEPIACRNYNTVNIICPRGVACANEP